MLARFARLLRRQFGNEPTALWQYGWALWVFRREGDCPASRQRLRAAFRSNRHLPGYLTGDSEWVDPAPQSYAMGSRVEAAICVEEVAKYRAMWRLWARLVRERFGVTDPRSCALRFHTQRGRRSRRSWRPSRASCDAMRARRSAGTFPRRNPAT